MFAFINVLIIISCLLLIIIVLVQNSKGGGLASSFSSSNQYMGVKKTADFLEKATWALAISLVVFCIIASLLPKNEESSQQVKTIQQIENAKSAKNVDMKTKGSDEN